MKHRFSNSRTTREKILKGLPFGPEGDLFESWADVPQELRVLILEDISNCIEEVLWK